MNRSRALLLGGIGFAIGAGFTIRQILRRQHLAKLADHTKIELLPNERGPMICMTPPITTVTFFRGSRATAEAHLAQRVQQIVTANPWLKSFLDRDEQGAMAAYYPNTTAATTCFAVREDITLTRETAYSALVKVLASASCKTSDASVGKPEPLWKVSLVPMEGEFAVVVSANHSLIDGHGFYRLYNMLSSGAEVQALSPVRKQDMPDKILAAMGGEPSLMSASPPGFLVRFIAGTIWNAIFPTTCAMGFEVSEQWIAQQKMEGKRQDNSVAFVSTNDVLTSAIARSLECDVAIMSINFRNKIEGCSDNDMGNYHDVVCYRQADYAAAALVRKSVAGAPYQRGAEPSTPMPGNWEHVTGGSYGAITNWSTFAKPLLIKGAEQLLHLPLFDFDASTPACVLGAAAVFQPRQGSVGVLCAGNSTFLERVKGTGMVGRPLEIGSRSLDIGTRSLKID